MIIIIILELLTIILQNKKLSDGSFSLVNLNKLTR